MTKYRDAIFKGDPRGPIREVQEGKKDEKTQKPRITATLDSHVAATVIEADEKMGRSVVRKAFLIYSRIHFKLRLRFATLFRAISIFRNVLSLPIQKKCDIPDEILLVVCLFLSMKYEEIYPPRLAKLLNILKIRGVEMKDYCKYEKAVIQLLKGNLNIVTPKTIMDSYLVNQPEVVHYHAYYLLELGFMEDKVVAYDFKEMCLGVLFIMTSYGDILKKKKRLESGVDERRVDECAKLIIKARYDALENESAIYRKYSQEAYKSVARSTTIFASME